MRLTDKHKITIIGVLMLAVISMVGLSVTNIRKSQAETVTPGAATCQFEAKIVNNRPFPTQPVDTVGTLRIVNLYRMTEYQVQLNSLASCSSIPRYCIFTITYKRDGDTIETTKSASRIINDAEINDTSWFLTQPWPEFSSKDIGAIRLKAVVKFSTAVDPPNQMYEINLGETIYRLYDLPVIEAPSQNSSETNNSTPTPSPTTNAVEPINQPSSATAELTQAEQACVEVLIGIDRYAAIHGGSSQPTTNELEKIKSCLESSSSILPNNFAPVEAAKAVVQKLEADSSVTVKKLENITQPDSTGKKKELLRISGVAKPNSIVLLYIFSDPIVVIAKADESGNWQYNLEDPLKPGKHEVYAVVDRGNGTYKRSEAMPFTIGTASATAGNPNGLSLSLADTPVETPTQSTRGLVFYVAGSVAVLAVVLVGLYFVIKKSRKNQIQPDVSSAASMTLPSYGSANSDENNPDNRLGQ